MILATTGLAAATDLPLPTTHLVDQAISTDQPRPTAPSARLRGALRLAPTTPGSSPVEAPPGWSAGSRPSTAVRHVPHALQHACQSGPDEPPAPRSTTAVRAALRGYLPGCAVIGGDRSGLRDVQCRHGSRRSCVPPAQRRPERRTATGRCRTHQPNPGNGRWGIEPGRQPWDGRRPPPSYQHHGRQHDGRRPGDRHRPGLGLDQQPRGGNHGPERAERWGIEPGRQPRDGWWPLPGRRSGHHHSQRYDGRRPGDLPPAGARYPSWPK